MGEATVLPLESLFLKMFPQIKETTFGLLAHPYPLMVESSLTLLFGAEKPPLAPSHWPFPVCMFTLR